MAYHDNAQLVIYVLKEGLQSLRRRKQTSVLTAHAALEILRRLNWQVQTSTYINYNLPLGDCVEFTIRRLGKLTVMELFITIWYGVTVS